MIPYLASFALATFAEQAGRGRSARWSPWNVDGLSCLPAHAGVIRLPCRHVTTPRALNSNTTTANENCALAVL